MLRETLERPQPGAHTTYPIPDRSNHVPNFKATGRNPVVDLGWAEGTLTDGRPFRLAVWQQEQLTMFEFCFSAIGLETLETPELVELLESEELIEVKDRRYRFVSTTAARDASGNPTCVVGSAVGDDAGACVELFVRLQRYQPTFGSSARAAECNWNRADLRAQLRIGTVLLANDGGVVTVLDITSEGILTYGLFTPRHLHSWRDMTELGMVIQSQPDPNAASPAPGAMRVRERGGRFTSDDVRQLRSADVMDRNYRSMDLLLIAELGPFGPRTSAGLRLSASTRSESEGGFHCALTDLAGVAVAKGPTVGLQVAIARFYEWTEECQGVPWKSFILTVTRGEGEHWRYEMTFNYPTE